MIRIATISHSLFVQRIGLQQSRGAWRMVRAVPLQVWDFDYVRGKTVVDFIFVYFSKHILEKIPKS